MPKENIPETPAEKIEAEVAEAEKADAAGTTFPRRSLQQLREDCRSYTHKFKEPFTYHGHTVESLSFHWDALTGKDSIAIDRELTAHNRSGAPDYGREHMMQIAIRACSSRDSDGIRIVDKGFMEALPIIDFEEITSMGRIFFRMWGLC